MRATILSIEPVFATDKNGEPVGDELINLQLGVTVDKETLQAILMNTNAWGVEIGIGRREEDKKQQSASDRK